MGRKLIFDKPLFFMGLFISLLGLLYVYSATWQKAEVPGPYFSTGFVKQSVFFLLALGVYFVCRRINWGLRPDTWVWFYVPVMILLLLVLLIGTDHGTGANRWLGIGIIDIQPSEFAKLAFVLILAWLFSWERHRLKKHYLVALGIMSSMLALILLQPDLGTGLVFVFIFFVMLAFTTIPRRYILATVLGFAILCIPAWFALKDYQKNRLLAFVGYELAMISAENSEDGVAHTVLQKASPQGVSFQLHQSIIAIGSGGLTGKGFLRGTQIRGDFVPEVNTDFIFALIGEEFGFFGCLLVLLLYFLLLARMLSISHNAKSSYERFIGYGCSALIFFHIFIGIGMTIGLTPITGLPLPFVSQGGSSLMTMWLLLAMNQAIYSNSHQEQQRSSFRL